MPAIHTKTRSYRITRALNGALRGKVDGLEAEVSAEVRRSNPGKAYRGQFSMPIDPSDEIRELMYPGLHRRDLTTSTGAGGIFTVPELPVIDLLRAKTVLGRCGATFLTEMPGPFGIPRASGASSTQWLSEGASAAGDNPVLDSVDFVPNVAVDLTNISRSFLASNSVSSERFVLDQATRNLAVALDYVGLDGQGPTANQPTGLFQNSAILSASSGLALGPNGGAAGWSNVVALEEAVALANADAGNLAYVATPQLRAALKKTPKIAGSTTGIFCWEDGPELGTGKVNSYRAEATNNVPSNLAKGTATGLSALAFGNFASLVVATFHDGIDWLVNPYKNQASASVVVSLVLSCDVNVMHPESFRVLTDCVAS